MAKKKENHFHDIRRKRTVDISCRFCLMFHNISDDDRNKKDRTRYCPAVKGFVSPWDRSCSCFDLSQTFWCDKWGFWSSPELCHYRMTGQCTDSQKKKIELLGFSPKPNNDCNRCEQGLQLYRFLNAPSITYIFTGEE